MSLERKVGLSILAVGLLVFMAAIVVIASGHGTELKPIATVAIKQTSSIEWASEPTILPNGKVEMSIHALKPDLFSVAYMDVSWGNVRQQVCTSPIAAPKITCEFDSKNPVVLPGPGPGEKLFMDVSVVNFNGDVVQMLPQKTVTLPGRSWENIFIGAAILAGLMTIGGWFLHRRRVRR